MKKLLFTPVFALLATTCATAQTFSMSPDTAVIFTTSDVSDIEVHNDMTNLTNEDITIEWVRTVLINPDTLETQVCDPNACYAPWIETKTFTLKADTTIPMIIHLLNPDGVDPYYAVVQLKYTDLANPIAPQYSYYIFNVGMASSTDSPTPVANVKLYPNPVVESFSLGNADEVRRVLVFSTDGRQVAAFNATPNSTYPLAGQPAGTYLVALEAQNGRVFQTISVRKD